MSKDDNTNQTRPIEVGDFVSHGDKVGVVIGIHFGKLIVNMDDHVQGFDPKDVQIFLRHSEKK